MPSAPGTGSIGDDRPIRLGFVTRGYPLGIGYERSPLLLSFGKRFPGEKIGYFLIGLPDQRRKEPGLPDAVLLPYLRYGRLIALQQRRQPARQTPVDAHLVDHL